MSQEQIKDSIIDTESPTVRKIRSLNQKKLDIMIHEGVLRGKPFLERLTTCRTELFGKFENVKGIPQRNMGRKKQANLFGTYSIQG